MPSHHSSHSGRWELQKLPSGEGGPVDARRFIHPERDPNFPAMYRLQNPHPLRPATFVPENCNSARPEFYDYVMTVRKEASFMKKWQEMGEQQETPRDDIAANKLRGTSSCLRK